MALRVAARPNTRPMSRADQRPYWLTAKAARVLGHAVPDDIADGDAITFVTNLKGS
jgi:hypothetical protein